MMNSRSSFVGLLLLLSLPLAAQEKQVKHVPVQPTPAESGKVMFTTYCAVCHGKDGTGKGPAADALKIPPANLTTLAKRNGGKFPGDRVASTITGAEAVQAHGSRDMPIWGALFNQMSHGKQSEVQLRVANLTKYVESLQAP